MDPTLATAIASRRAQIGIARGALGVSGVAIAPLHDYLGAEAVKHLELGAPGTFDALRVGTRGEATSFDALVRLLREVYEVRGPVLSLLDDLFRSLDRRAWTLVLEESPTRVEPRIEVGIDAPVLVDAIEDVLGWALPPTALAGFRATADGLRSSRARSVILHLDQPASEPIVETIFPWTHDADLRPQLVQALTATCERMAVAPAQTRWFTGVLAPLAPRPINETAVSVAIGPDGVVPRLAVDYPGIPATLVLSMLGPFHTDPALGTHLGVLAGAASAEDDVVTSLRVAIAGAAPPDFRITFEAPLPPGTPV